MAESGGQEASGCLYVCATPLGNLEDVSFRLVRILQECAVIAAEDTRVTRKLLSHYGIHTPLISCHQHSGRPRLDRLVDRLKSGESVALVCNAGTPTISDPGGELADLCAAAGIRLVPVPGPAAVTAALSVAGLPSARFWFQGFLPRRGAARSAALNRLAAVDDGALVLYEAPQRTLDTLTDLHGALGDRPATLCRELTKKFEEVVRGSLGELRDWAAAREVRGEVTLVIGPCADGSASPCAVDEETLTRALQAALAAGLSARDAVKQVATEFGAPRNLVYRLAQKAHCG